MFQMPIKTNKKQLEFTDPTKERLLVLYQFLWLLKPVSDWDLIPQFRQKQRWQNDKSSNLLGKLKSIFAYWQSTEGFLCFRLESLADGCKTMEAYEMKSQIIDHT